MVRVCKMERKNRKIQRILINKGMKTQILFLITITLVAVLNSCTGIYEDGTELAQASKHCVKQISVSELHAKIDNGEDFLLLDVRQTNDYLTNNISGSISIPRGTLEFNINNEEFWAKQYIYPPSKDSTEIVVYCKSEKRGILAVQTLMQLGYKNVKNLEGGYDAFNPNQDPNAKPKVSSGGCGG